MSDASSRLQSSAGKKRNVDPAGAGGRIVDVLTNSWLVVGSCVLIVMALEMLG